MPLLDCEQVKHAASGRWAQIICDIGGISDDYLTTQHVACPKCGGTKPFRVFNDFAQTGGCVCSRCGNFGDGFATIQWSQSITFEESLKRVADYLGISESATRKILPGVKPKRLNRKRDIKPIESKAEDIEPINWSHIQVALWCKKKQPATPESLKASGAYLARYKQKYTVLVLPIREGDNWAVYNITGGTLPGGQNEWCKVKNINRHPGWMQA